MGSLARQKFHCSDLASDELAEKLKKRNDLKDLGITKKVLNYLEDIDLKEICEGIKLDVPREVLRNQNPLENLLMYRFVISLKKANQEIPQDIPRFVNSSREMFWRKKTLAKVSSRVKYPLEMIPIDLQIERLQNLPSQTIQEFFRVISQPYAPEEIKYHRKTAINEIYSYFHQISEKAE